MAEIDVSGMWAASVARHKAEREAAATVRKVEQEVYYAEVAAKRHIKKRKPKTGEPSPE